MNGSKCEAANECGLNNNPESFASPRLASPRLASSPAGNILVRTLPEGDDDDVQLVLLDFGLAESLPPRVRSGFVAFLFAIGRGDGDEAAGQLLRWSTKQARIPVRSSCEGGGFPPASPRSCARRPLAFLLSFPPDDFLSSSRLPLCQRCPDPHSFRRAVAALFREKCDIAKVRWRSEATP